MSISAAAICGRAAISIGGWLDFFVGLVEAVEPRLGADAQANVATVRAAMAEKLAALTPRGELPRLRLELARLAYDADIVLDLHCDDEALMHVFMMPQHWPGGADLAAELGVAACMLCDDSARSVSTKAIRCLSPSCTKRWATGSRSRRPASPRRSSCAARPMSSMRWPRPTRRRCSASCKRRGIVAGDPGPLPPLLCAATTARRHRLCRSAGAGHSRL
ncbi:MAG: hypothetical protein WDN69_11790 [Aliidongia sp.]